jgi:probable HAF family extracellular repeat protein
MKSDAFLKTTILIALLLLLLAGVVQADKYYRLTDLGHLSGGWESEAAAINNLGQITGNANYRYSSGKEFRYAFFWQEGSGMQNLGTTGGLWYSIGSGIDDTGQVTGHSYNASGPFTSFLWQAGTPIAEIGSFRANGINNVGQVVGYSDAHNLGVVWQAGDITVLDPPEDHDGYRFTGTAANGANDIGQVVGGARFWAYDPYPYTYQSLHACVWNHGVVVDLDPITGRNEASVAWGVNDGGQIVGHKNNIAHLWNGGPGGISLGALSGDTQSFAYAINNHGQIVGQSGGTATAVLWEGGIIYDLNSQVICGDEWVHLAAAKDVNDEGQIVGVGRFYQGTYGPYDHGFLLTPVAEVHTISGWVLDAKGGPVPDVTVSTHTDVQTVTDSNGYYSIKLCDSGTYTITPSKGGFEFAPPSRVAAVPPDAVGIDFTAVPESVTYTISGLVTDEGGNALSDVTVNADPGQIVTSTDFNGEYTLEVPGSGAYHVAPTKVGYSFEPPDYNVTVPPDAGDVNFTGVNPPPAKVDDFEITGIVVTAGKVVLSWTAPGADGQTGGPAAQYDIRTGSEPIDDSNWDSFDKWSEVPTPGEPGELQEIQVTLYALNKKRYYALKTADAEGNWSELSNWAAVLDSGFRSNTDGYAFKNFCGDYYTVDHMRALLGDEKVCLGFRPECTPTQLAEQKLEHILAIQKSDWCGHCLGIAVTCLRFFEGLDITTAFNAEADTTVELKLEDVSDHIAYYHGAQFFKPLKRPIKIQYSKTHSQILDELMNAMSQKSNSISIGFCLDNTYKRCHSIVPEAIFWNSAEGQLNRFDIVVYDSIGPLKHPRMTIDKDQNWWGYLKKGDGSYIYEGRDNNTLDITPIFLFKEPLQASQGDSESDSIEILLSGPGHLLIRDEQGNRLGYQDDLLISEIPDGFASAVLTNLNAPLEPIYTLPAGGRIYHQHYRAHVTARGRCQNHATGIGVCRLG